VDDLDAALLEQIEATVLTPEALAYVVNKAEEAIRQSLAQIQAFERDLERLDAEIEGLEARARHGQLDVARALRELEPALAA
jgi:peptidoglycan hydrolase CwlO-like protein